MRSTRPSDGQLALAFVRNVNNVLKRPLGLTTHAKHLLRVFLAEPYQTVWMSDQTMADAMSTTKRSAQRAKRELLKERLIGKVEKHIKGKQSARWQISTANIFALAEESNQIERPNVAQSNQIERPNGEQNGMVMVNGINTKTIFHHSVARWRAKSLTPDDLRDPEAIDALLGYAIDQGKWGNSESERIAFHALCAHCLRAGDAPGRLLTSRVFQGVKVEPTLEDVDTARESLRQYDRKRRTADRDTDPFVAALAGKWTATEVESHEDPDE